MNFEDDEEYVEALHNQFKTELIDNELYISVYDLDRFIDKIALLVIQQAHPANGGICEHAMGMAQWIIGQIAGVTDTSTALVADQLVSELSPEDIIGTEDY